MNVAPLLDDIQEELKREDRMRLFKQWLPAIVVTALVALGAAGGYSWHHQSQQTSRIRHENYYTQAKEALSKGDTGKAHAMMTQLVQDAPALRLLALSELAHMDMQHCVHASASSSQADANTQADATEDPLRQAASRARAMLARHHQLAISLTSSKAYREWVCLMAMMVDAATNQPFYGPQPLVQEPLSLALWAAASSASLPAKLSSSDMTNLQGVYDTESWSFLWKTMHAERMMAKHAKDNHSAETSQASGALWSWWQSAVAQDPQEMTMHELAFLGSRPQPWLAGGRP